MRLLWQPVGTKRSIPPSASWRATGNPDGTAFWSASHSLRSVAILDAESAQRRPLDRAAMMALAQDLPSVWNGPLTDARTKQRFARIVIHEVIFDLDDVADEVIVTIHWVVGRHTEIRMPRVKTGRYPSDRHPSLVMRKLGGKWPDRQLAVTMNRMRCKFVNGGPLDCGAREQVA
jgi:hypothetical protein